MPETGRLLLHEEGSLVWLVDTRAQCGDGGLGCLETRVRIRIELGFGNATASSDSDPGDDGAPSAPTGGAG